MERDRDDTRDVQSDEFSFHLFPQPLPQKASDRGHAAVFQLVNKRLKRSAGFEIVCGHKPRDRPLRGQAVEGVLIMRVGFRYGTDSGKTGSADNLLFFSEQSLTGKTERREKKITQWADKPLNERSSV
jgi:hypothetical protein